MNYIARPNSTIDQSTLEHGLAESLALDDVSSAQLDEIQAHLIEELVDSHFDKLTQYEEQVKTLKEIPISIVSSEIDELTENIVKLNKEFNRACTVYSERDLYEFTRRLDHLVANLIVNVNDQIQDGMPASEKQIFQLAMLATKCNLNNHTSTDAAKSLLKMAFDCFKETPSDRGGTSVIMALHGYTGELMSGKLSIDTLNSKLQVISPTSAHLKALRQGLASSTSLKPRISRHVTRAVEDFLSTNSPLNTNKTNINTNEVPKPILADLEPVSNLSFIDPSAGSVEFARAIDRYFDDSSLLRLPKEDRDLLVEQADQFLIGAVQTEKNSSNQPNNFLRIGMKPINVARILLGMSVIATQEQYYRLRTLVDPNIAVTFFDPSAIKLISIADLNQGLPAPFSKKVMSAVERSTRIRRAPDEIERATSILLKRLGIASKCGGFVAPYEVDVLIFEPKIAIEFNGVKYHANRDLADSTKTRILESKGYKVLTYPLYDKVNITELVGSVIKDVQEIVQTLNPSILINQDITSYEINGALNKAASISNYDRIRNLPLSKLLIRHIESERTRRRSRILQFQYQD